MTVSSIHAKIRAIMSNEKFRRIWDLLITIPFIILSVILANSLSFIFVHPEIYPAQTTLVSILIMLFTTIMTAGSLVKNWPIIKGVFYARPKKILEYGIDAKDFVADFIFGCFSMLITTAIITLMLSIPAGTFQNFIPYGENLVFVDEINTFLRNFAEFVFTKSGVGVPYNENFNINTADFAVLFGMGPGIMIISRGLRRISIKNNEDSEEEKHPGSRSIIIFFYVTVFIAMQKINTPEFIDRYLGVLSSSLFIIVFFTAISVVIAMLIKKLS